MVTRRIDIIDHSDFPHSSAVHESESQDAGFDSDHFLFQVNSEALDVAAVGSLYDHPQIQMREYEGAFDDSLDLPRLTSRIGDLADSFYLRYGLVKPSDAVADEDEGLDDFARRGVSLKLHDGSGE